MHRAVDQLKIRPQHLLIDGNRFKKYQDLPHTTVVKGDGKYLSIAAASILAKTYRDDYMNGLHKDILFMIGIVIKVILLKSIVRLFVNMEQRHIIG